MNPSTLGQSRFAGADRVPSSTNRPVCEVTSNASEKVDLRSGDLFGPIAGDLEEVERILDRELRSRHVRVAQVVDHVRQYRGKRLRPVLVLLTARACGRVTPAHHVLGAVVEMIHTATLVHDDILDGAQIRRRVATVNGIWGTHTSVLLGDYLFTHAFHLTSTVDSQACRVIGQATDRVCEGELRQILEQGNLELSEQDYFEIIDGKTAALTACCCQLGAMYSEANEEQVQALTRFGRWLGQAFQIADDLLDLVGEEQATGKSLGTDLEQQKLTLPLIRLLQSGGSGRAQQARQILACSGNHKRDALCPLLHEAGALSYARQRAENLAQQARDELACLPASEYRTILQTITEQVVHRTA